MEQIQQHKWEKTTGIDTLRCRHCKCVKLEFSTGEIKYLPDYGSAISEEPACITRYPEPSITKFEQAIKDTAKEAGKL